MKHKCKSSVLTGIGKTRLPYISGLLVFSGLWLATVAGPGPNFVRISHLTLTFSPRHGFSMACGTALGNCLWCTAAVLGTAHLLAVRPFLISVQLVGSAYLIWSAIQMLRQAIPGNRKTFAEHRHLPRNRFSLMRFGVLTALSNPQAIVFFATIQITCFPSGAPPGIHLISVLLVGMITLAWYAFVVSVLGAPKFQSLYLRLARIVDGALAAILLLMAAQLLWKAWA